MSFVNNIRPQMNRREFITLLGGSAATWPLAARAQQGERTRRIGVLLSYAADDPETPSRLAAILSRLQELGWTVGRNMRVDYRYNPGDSTTYRKYAAELVALALEAAPLPATLLGVRCLRL
jgi:putative ABC transport system substrate-binding protein